jgi:predicted phage terminase large subunit-like protein
MRTVIPAGDQRTNVFIVGTVLHYDSLLAHLTGASGNERIAGWDGRVYRAVEEFADRVDLWDQWERIYRGAEEHEGEEGQVAARKFFESQRDEMLRGTVVLWPEREPYEALMEMRVQSGRGVFDAEKQNDPLDPEVCLFRPETFCYWNHEYPDAASAIEGVGSPYVHCAVDPSLGGGGAGGEDGATSGGGGRGDFSGIVVGVTRGSDEPIYLLHAELVRLAPNDLAARIASICAAHRVRTLWIEANGYQALFARTLKNAMREAGRNVSVKEIRNTGNKAARIASLEPYISTGRLRFSRQQTALLEQLRRFPLADHDDGPDALEMLIRGIEKPRPRISTA